MSCRIKPQATRGKQRRSNARSVGERLYDWRRRNNLSQSEAALRLKISKRTLQEWEQDRARPRHLALNALVALIGR